MTKRKITKPLIITCLILFSLTGIGFLSSQESRDFKITKNLDILFSLFRELNTFYVDEINPDKIIKTGIDNMLMSLDPYTVYYPESNVSELDFMTTGKYGGIGSLIRGGDNYVTISNVYKGFPADKAGLKAGDLLKKIDGVSLKGLTTEQVSNKLKGTPGTNLTVTFERLGKDRETVMKREKVAIPPVPWYGMIDNNTGYICFTGFTQNCVQDVRAALLDLKSHNPSQIILDIRSNGGGSLSEAVEIVNLFVGPGREVVATRGKVKRLDESFKTVKDAVDDSIRLAILINRASASASEIVAGAIQDLDRGVIIGERSYGKGLVQIIRPLSYNTQLKVTTAKYYTPSGRCVQALDFTHRNEDGSVGFIPDSLISEFKTKNGRIVKDGGGISPDIESKPEQLSQLTSELYVRNYIFDFATQYYWSHPNITDVSHFTLTDKDFEDFHQFLTDKHFTYKTKTEKTLSDLIAAAKQEKYYDLHRETFSKLEKDISHSLEQDLALFREEITDLLYEEIIGRYFYEEGTIEWSAKNDKQVHKAIEILNDKDKYEALLSAPEI